MRQTNSHDNIMPPKFTACIRISRVMTRACDPGTVEIVFENIMPSTTTTTIIVTDAPTNAKPSEAPPEITLQRESMWECLKCGGEAGHCLSGCPALAAALSAQEQVSQ